MKIPIRLPCCHNRRCPTCLGCGSTVSLVERKSTGGEVGSRGVLVDEKARLALVRALLVRTRVLLAEEIGIGIDAVRRAASGLGVTAETAAAIESWAREGKP